MHWLVSSLDGYGEVLVFAIILLEQAGLPLPSALALLAGGALAGQGVLNGPAVVALALLATLSANYAWCRAGWRYGHRVLGLLCHLSLDPDECVRVTETLFGKLGVASLVIAKFVPGLATVAPPLAGVLRVPQRRFLLLNGAGAVLWVGVTVSLGYLFSNHFEQVAQQMANWGLTAGAALLALIVGWVGFKALQRWLMIRRLRLARITAEELARLLQMGEPPLVLDLRHPLQRERLPQAIPGALRMAPAELRSRHGEIPRDRDVVLYCS